MPREWLAVCITRCDVLEASTGMPRIELDDDDDDDADALFAQVRLP